MTREDEKELLRLADMLQEIDTQIGSSSPWREGLVKAGLALSHSFIHGFRSKLEEDYEFLDNLRTGKTPKAPNKRMQRTRR